MCAATGLLCLLLLIGLCGCSRCCLCEAISRRGDIWAPDDDDKPSLSSTCDTLPAPLSSRAFAPLVASTGSNVAAAATARSLAWLRVQLNFSELATCLHTRLLIFGHFNWTSTPLGAHSIELTNYLTETTADWLSRRRRRRQTSARLAELPKLLVKIILIIIAITITKTHIMLRSLARSLVETVASLASDNYRSARMIAALKIALLRLAHSSKASRKVAQLTQPAQQTDRLAQPPRDSVAPALANDDESTFDRFGERRRRGTGSTWRR